MARRVPLFYIYILIMDIIDKLKNNKTLDDDDIFRLESIVKWSVDNQIQEIAGVLYKDNKLLVKTEDINENNISVEKVELSEIAGLVEEAGLKEEEEVEEEEDDEKKISSMQLNEELDTETRMTEGYIIGKVLDPKGEVKSIRARNLLFVYPDGTVDNQIREKLNKRIPNAEITNLGGGAYSVYRESRVCAKSPKMFSASGKVPEIRTFSYQMLKNKVKNINIKEGTSAVKYLLMNPLEEDYPDLRNALKKSLENINILYYSEYILSCVFVGYVVNLGVEMEWESLKVFSIDSKMEEYDIKNNLSNFRCDLILIYKGTLFVIEFKYRFDRPLNTGEQAIACIIEKKYPVRALKFIQLNYPDLFEEIHSVIGVGIGYNLQDNKITCFIKTCAFQKTVADEYEVHQTNLRNRTIKENRNMINQKRKKEKK